jgi:hypothetical protein
MTQNDILELKDMLHRKKGRVLPTIQDTWVSLHPSAGLVCWCDDETLGQQFLESGSVCYVCVSAHVSGICMKSSHNEDNDLSCFLQAVGISPLSKVRDPFLTVYIFLCI